MENLIRSKSFLVGSNPKTLLTHLGSNRSIVVMEVENVYEGGKFEEAY